MSVQVHTSPTALPLGPPQWEPLMKSPPPVFSETEAPPESRTRSSSTSGPRKRRFQNQRGGFQAKRRRHSSRGQMILPSKFLLGGNISDPLNLNGLSESDEVTPVSSPLPTGHKDGNVNIIIPPNITDPLNLVESDDDANDELFYNLAHKKKKHKRRNTKEKEVKDMTLGPLNIDTEVASSHRKGLDQAKISPAIAKDKIVSPVIPQTHQRASKRRRTLSEGPQVTQPAKTKEISDEEPSTSKQQEKTPEPKPKVTPKTKRQNSNQKSKEPKGKRKEKKDSKFIHGNYNRYYGYRNPNAAEDNRIKYFESGWFTGKDVLDVGCNTGHMTLTIARDFHPQKIVGVDIDSYLVGVARKNIRHYLVADKKKTDEYPVSMAMCYGPLSREKVAEFPNNVFFRQGDFVLESDELLDLQKSEYDVIMGLSLTKWIHLNHGDAGLKRTFKRFYRMLRPGGKLILEPQGWASYGKRKKLTDTIFKNYQSIRFRPEHFKDFLMSRHVGFSACQQLDIPFNKAQGFRRPIYVFTKQNQPEPMVTFDLPKRVPRRPTPLRPDATPNSVDSNKFSAPGTPFSAPGTPFSVPGTPGRTTPYYYAPSPCSVQSCSECKRRVENGFTPGTESPQSPNDYCSQCSGNMTPGKLSTAGSLTPGKLSTAGSLTPGKLSTGARTPSGNQTPGSQYSEKDSEKEESGMMMVNSYYDPGTPGESLSGPTTPVENGPLTPVENGPLTPSEFSDPSGPTTPADYVDSNLEPSSSTEVFEPHTPLEAPPMDFTENYYESDSSPKFEENGAENATVSNGSV